MLSHVFHQVRISLILSFVLVCASVFGMTGYAHADDEMPNEPAPTREMAQEEQNHTSGALAHRIGIDAPSKGDMTHDVQITGQASASGTLAPEPGDAPDSKPQTTPDENALNPTSAGWYRTADGSWYYFTSIADKPKTGWLCVDGAWYWLDPTKNGLMAADSWIDDGNAEYFVTASGAMKTGWHKDGDTWYYLNASGRKHTGWAYLGNRWYDLNPDDGAMKTGRYKVGGTWYVSDASGAMYADAWAPVGADWYYATASGAPMTGWLYTGGHWYWLDPEKDGLMVAATNRTIEGALYSFDNSGAMRTFCKVDTNDGTYRYATASGAALQIGVCKNGKVVLQDASGTVLTGWHYLADRWFYGEAKTGILHTGWLELDGAKYYLDASGAMLTGTHTIDGKPYYFAASGALTERPYMNAAASERLLAAVDRTPYQGNGYCAKWTNYVYVNAGYPHPDGNACDLYWKYCNISDLDFMEPGMIIAVPSHTRTGLGQMYGHVAIYMGNGLVRHNTNTIETTSLSDWLAYYQTTYTAKCGWAFR